DKNFDIMEKQYQEQLKAQVTKQGSTAVMAPVYTQLNLSYKKVEFYVSPDAALDGFSNIQYVKPQDQVQYDPVPVRDPLIWDFLPN
ncbi:hypothetical protein DSO57_1010990, partial [Entomophthora muscae]